MRHHINPIESFDNWTPQTVVLPDVPWIKKIDFIVWQDAREIARQRAAIKLDPVILTNTDVNALVAFLRALTGRASTKGILGIPEKVPSGLPVDKRLLR